MSAFLSSRKTIRAEDLRGPRIYSTDLYPAMADLADPDASVEVTARALKVKIITKGLVTLNSAYLVSPLAVRLVERFPDLLDGPAILPAFRADKDGLTDLITSNEDYAAQGISDDQLGEHIARLEATISQAMPWTVGQADERFRTLLLDGLRHSQSLICRALKEAGLDEAAVRQLADDIEQLDLSHSVNLRTYINERPEGVHDPLNRFMTACYHMVGTGVVRCEAGTDLNPLSAFRSADLMLAGRDCEAEALSEEAIFTEAFMGFALDTIQAAALPTQILDAMDFKTAHELSEALRAQGFQDKYDGIVRQYLTAADLPNDREALETLDAEKIGYVAAELAREFQKSILDELPSYESSVQSNAKADFVKARADVAKDFASAMPGIGNVVSVAEGLSDAAKLQTAYSELRSVRKLSSALVKAEEKRHEKILEAINTLNLDDKKRATFLDAVAVMSDVHGVAIARA